MSVEVTYIVDRKGIWYSHRITGLEDSTQLLHMEREHVDNVLRDPKRLNLEPVPYYFKRKYVDGGKIITTYTKSYRPRE